MPRVAKLEVRPSRWGGLPLREMLIDGRTIDEVLAKSSGDLSRMLETCVSPLGWLVSAGGAVTVARFLPDGPADFSNGHRAVLVCRECGDFGCGALTVRIARLGDHVVWSDWLWQVDFDQATHDFSRPVPPITFQGDQYLAALRAALA